MVKVRAAAPSIRIRLEHGATGDWIALGHDTPDVATLLGLLDLVEDPAPPRGTAVTVLHLGAGDESLTVVSGGAPGQADEPGGVLSLFPRRRAADLLAMARTWLREHGAAAVHVRIG